MENENQPDFSKFFLSEAEVFDLEDPNGNPLVFNGQPARVHLYGPATSVFSRAKAKQNDEATKRVVAAMASKGKKSDKADEDADAKFLCSITEKFENFPFPGGAEAIYREPRLLYINNQVQQIVGDLGNFFKGGKKT